MEKITKTYTVLKIIQSLFSSQFITYILASNQLALQCIIPLENIPDFSRAIKALMFLIIK